MDSQQTTAQTIDEYIARYPADIQAILLELRATIRAAAPEAKEIISYAMPAFAQDGNLVYFAVLKHHIGFYPTASGIAAFQPELAGYKGTKGAVNFPIGQPLPLDLIARIVRFRVNETRERAAAKARGKAPKKS